MKKILVVEGNLKEENQSFSEAGIQTHTESLKHSLSYFTDQLNIDVVNPSSDENISENIDTLESYEHTQTTLTINENPTERLAPCLCTQFELAPLRPRAVEPPNERKHERAARASMWATCAVNVPASM